MRKAFSSRQTRRVSSRSAHPAEADVARDRLDAGVVGDHVRPDDVVPKGMSTGFQVNG